MGAESLRGQLCFVAARLKLSVMGGRGRRRRGSRDGWMYRGRLKRDIDHWVGEGLLSRSVAEALLAEYDSRKSSFSIGAVLMILAAVLLSASILMLIAAHWEAIPRLVKLGGVLVLIWVFHLGAALAAMRDAPRLEAALLVLGSATFGGAVALVAQLYHLSGDAIDAMLLWFAMTVLSAALFRSGALTVMAGLLSWSVFAFHLDENATRWNDIHAIAVVVTGLVQIPLILWTRAHRAQHFVYLLALAFLTWLYFNEGDLRMAVAMAAVGAAVFAAVTLRGSPLSALSVASAAPAFYSLVLALLGFLLLHGEYAERAGPTAGLAVACIALTILALSLAGRDNGAVRYLAYCAFAAEVLYLSFITIDTMLGTSGFFLFSGVVVAVLAFVVIRMEKLFAARAAARRTP